LLIGMSREARSLADAAADGRPLKEQRLAYMRYTGQGHEIAVELPQRKLDKKDIEEIRTRFEADYRALFERHIPGARIEILSWSVLVTTEVEPPEPLAVRRSSAIAKASGAREVWDPGASRHVSIATHLRSAIKPGARVAGPALILESGTTTLVTAAFEASIDAGGALVLERKKPRRGKA
jgi:N-methylhydantoinase A